MQLPLETFGGPQFRLQDLLLVGVHHGTDCSNGFMDQYKMVGVSRERAYVLTGAKKKPLPDQLGGD